MYIDDSISKTTISEAIRLNPSLTPYSSDTILAFGPVLIGERIFGWVKWRTGRDNYSIGLSTQSDSVVWYFGKGNGPPCVGGDHILLSNRLQTHDRCG